jgi:hypothetical protein
VFTEGGQDGEMMFPKGVAVNQQSGDIIVADSHNHRVQVFDYQGNFKFKFGQMGDANGQVCYELIAAKPVCSYIIH